MFKGKKVVLSKNLQQRIKRVLSTTNLSTTSLNKSLDEVLQDEVLISDLLNQMGDDPHLGIAAVAGTDYVQKFAIIIQNVSGDTYLVELSSRGKELETGYFKYYNQTYSERASDNFYGIIKNILERHNALELLQCDVEVDTDLESLD